VEKLMMIEKILQREKPRKDYGETKEKSLKTRGKPAKRSAKDRSAGLSSLTTYFFQSISVMYGHFL
jgi:hypothetical protein